MAIRFDEPFLDVSSVLKRWGVSHGTEPFTSQWDKRDPLGMPGPLYVGDDDACGTGPEAAPNNVFQQGYDGEFIFRQPATEYELRQLVLAAEINVVFEYGCDGNQHWTPDAVVAWWESIQPVRENLRKAISEHDEGVRRLYAEGMESSAERERLEKIRPSSGLRRWLDYLDHGAETYLRRYMYFLSHWRVPTVEVHALPELKTWR